MDERCSSHKHRRPPAHQSVSLRHTPSARVSATPSAEKSTLGQHDVSPTLAAAKQDSGESSDAGQWFENTNRNAEQTSATAEFVDNDPPFLLRNSSSSETPPEGHVHYGAEATPMPFRPGFTRMHTDGSSGEDFRGVIDDLTVANKKLKQKLKKYEKQHAAHLQDEKLFEVKFHGVPDHKKKELEDMLRKFAVSLHEAAAEDQPAPLKAEYTLSSMHATESGYATMSGSGQNSTSGPSGTGTGMGVGTGPDSDFRKTSKASSAQYNQQQSNVRSYLHDIPTGLLPRQNAPMSDAAKKKLVVRRLEQVFAGKMSTPASNQQPQQQEEVAQSAAMADRLALGVSNAHFTEGHREALMMPTLPDPDTSVADPVTGSGSTSNDQSYSDRSSPDQRPTRPLDLDPARAQIPAENVEYMRHLGFTLPSSGETPLDGSGWIYLNFLINMAQLHTINVTPDFVKDALKEYSSMFELSHDGRKVRWRGGNDITINSSDSSSEHLSGNSAYENNGRGSSRSESKRPKTDDPAEAEKQARKARLLKEKERNKLNYTPLFFHRQDSEEDDIYNGVSSSSNSPPFVQPHGDSSGFTSTGVRSESSRRKRDEGPMIFYSKANFCTDLSGDRQGVAAAIPTTSYESISSQPLGTTPKESITFTSPFGITEPRGPLNMMDMDLDPKDNGAANTSSEDEFALSLPELRSEAGRSPMPVDFVASGLGGIQPDDNFAIRVKRQQIRSESSSFGGYYRRKSMYNKKILDVLSEDHRKSPPGIKERILSTSQQVLPSSELPPASYLPFDSNSSGGVDSDLESDVSSSPSTSSSKANAPVVTTPQVYHISPVHGSNSADDPSSGSVSEDDGSLELAPQRDAAPLPTIGSGSDSDTNMTDHFEEIPPGSSAATAGGGSGFNSPLDFGNGHDDSDSAAKANQPCRSSSAASPAGLKRARTSDSISAALQESAKSQRIR